MSYVMKTISTYNMMKSKVSVFIDSKKIIVVNQYETGVNAIKGFFIQDVSSHLCHSVQTFLKIMGMTLLTFTNLLLFNKIPIYVNVSTFLSVKSLQ